MGTHTGVLVHKHLHEETEAVSERCLYFETEKLCLNGARFAHELYHHGEATSYEGQSQDTTAAIINVHNYFNIVTPNHNKYRRRISETTQVRRSYTYTCTL